MFVKLEYNNLITDFTSQKLIKKKLNEKKKILYRKLITFNRLIDFFLKHNVRKTLI
jgi:hypothetical protein